MLRLTMGFKPPIPGSWPGSDTGADTNRPLPYAHMVKLQTESQNWKLA